MASWRRSAFSNVAALGNGASAVSYNAIAHRAKSSYVSIQWRRLAVNAVCFTGGDSHFEAVAIVGILVTPGVM